jgi:NCAIR mutase (PurE)-related protein
MMTSLDQILSQFQSGQLSIEEVKQHLSLYSSEILNLQAYTATPSVNPAQSITPESQAIADLGFAQLDLGRAKRTGFPEVIFGEGKTSEQIAQIMQTMIERSDRVLATRVDATKAQYVCTQIPALTYHKEARALSWQHPDVTKNEGYVAVVCAGTSDLPVAEEACVTAICMGNRVERVYDVGVAGIHRLFNRLPVIRGANAIVVVAGMEGALASVLGGLVDKPLVAVPTSIGYGANFQGFAALLSMLNACAPGIAVVNIDNGFGAGYYAGLINHNLHLRK